MQYLYHPQSGTSTLTLEGENHRYLFKVRRLTQGATIALRNLNDGILYFYQIISIDKKEAMLSLVNQEASLIKSDTSLHIGWCLIDPKNIEKVLPMLNEIGVEKITFIKCTRSQQNFKLETKRLERILLASSQQCGRSEFMQIDTVTSLKDFLKNNPDAYLLDFSTNTKFDKDDVKTIVIGCEGGFTKEEVGLFDTTKIIGFSTPLILRSESAVCAISTKILLG